MNWQVQEAKQRFSELLRAAHADGPQVVTRHGEEMAAVVDITDWHRMSGSSMNFRGMERWLVGLHVSCRSRIIEIDASIAEEWGRINVPDPVPVVDGLLAASAIVRDWTLVTRNVRDVQHCGVRLLNPFEPLTA